MHAISSPMADSPYFHGSPDFSIPVESMELDQAYLDDFISPAAADMDKMLLHGFEDVFLALEEECIPSNTSLLSQDSQQQPSLTEQLQANSLTDLLLAGAEAVGAENWQGFSAVATALERVFFDQENEANSFRRLCYYFTLGLQSRMIGIDVLLRSPAPPAENMSAQQMVQELTPYVKFAHFSANQAILEAAEHHRELHIIDFDVMDGIQWPPIMADLSRRGSFSLRITAVASTTNERVVSRTGQRLLGFAESIGLRLLFDQIVLENEQDFDAIDAGDVPVIANCMVYQTRNPSRSFKEVKTFLQGVKRLSPEMIVVVEEELFSSVKKTPCMSFLEFFREALYHFSALHDSLLSSFDRNYEAGMKLVEKELLGPSIVDSVSRFGRGTWRCESDWSDGFGPIALSAHNISQAKFLVGIFSRGYSVQREDGRLALCWNSRPLTSVSVFLPS